MVSPIEWGILGLFAVVGAVTVLTGLVRLQKSWTMWRMDPADVTTTDGGFRAFEGEARAVDGTVTAPFTGTESVVCRHVAEKHSPSTGGSDWNLLDAKTRSVPFEVDCGDGSVAVDAKGATRLLTEEFEFTTGEDVTVPDRLRSCVDGDVDLGPHMDSLEGALADVSLDDHNMYRFRE